MIRWLETLSLGQYSNAFREATVDGSFLMELREEDLVQVLGIRHKLHVRKILISRERLKPLTEKELEVDNVYMLRSTAPLGDISILQPMKQLEKAEMLTTYLSNTSLLKVINYSSVQALNSYY